MRVALFCLFATGDFRLTDVFGSLAYNGDMAITQSSINLPLLMLQISGDELAADENGVASRQPETEISTTWAEITA
jgi:hypothetical protein